MAVVLPAPRNPPITTRRLLAVEDDAALLMNVPVQYSQSFRPSRRCSVWEHRAGVSNSLPHRRRFGQRSFTAAESGPDLKTKEGAESIRQSESIHSSEFHRG